MHSTILVASFLLLVQCEVIVYSPGAQIQSFTVVQFYNNFEANATTEVVYWTNDTLDGKIALHPGYPFGQPAKTLRSDIQACLSKGAVGIFFLDGQDPGEFSLSETLAPSVPHIPLGLIDTAGFNFLVQGAYNVSVPQWDVNLWQQFVASPGFVVYLVILTFLYASNCLIATALLINWLRFLKGCKQNIVVACLCLDIASNFGHTIQFILYPLFNLFHILNVDVANTVPLPFNLASSILIIFFWLDLTSSNTQYQGSWLGVMRIPAYVVISLLFLAEIIIDLLKLTNAPLGSILAAVYISIMVIIAIFYFIAAHRVFNALKEKSTKRAGKIRAITFKIIASGVCSLFTLIVAIVNSVVQEQYLAYLVSYFLVWFGLWGQSLCQILIFSNPIKSKSQSGSDPARATSESQQQSSSTA